MNQRLFYVPFSVFFKGLCNDVLDYKLGEVLTVTVFATIAFAAFLLENDNFVALKKSGFCFFATTVVGLVRSYFTYYFCAFHGGCAYLDITIGVNQQNAVECYGIACFGSVAEIVYIQELAAFGFELLSLNFYNCVHYIINIYINPLRRSALALHSLFIRPIAENFDCKGSVFFLLIQIFQHHFMLKINTITQRRFNWQVQN